jgi:hypothetical protein
VISFIGNRPALQIGPYQVIDYDMAWLDLALQRAVMAADLGDFPFVEDIRNGVSQYLETKCPLRLLPLDELFERVKRMLNTIGCQEIAENLEILAPPVRVSLVQAAMAAGNGFELAFFETLRTELGILKAAGVEEIYFTGARDSAMILRGAAKWNKFCEALLQEINDFLRAWDRDQPDNDRQLKLCMEGEH